MEEYYVYLSHDAAKFVHDAMLQDDLVGPICKPVELQHRIGAMVEDRAVYLCPVEAAHAAEILRSLGHIAGTQPYVYWMITNG